MTTVRLSLKRRLGGRAPRATAWLIPGTRTETWLEELAHWDLRLETLRLLVLPISPTDPAPRGLLVITGDGETPRHASRALGYTCRAGRVLLPVDAELDPPAEDHELDALIAARWLVLHPTLGAIAFDERDVLDVTALIRWPLPHSRRRDRARPGVTLAPRLRSILPIELPTFADVVTELDRDHEDLGERPLDDLLTPSERKRRARRRWQRPVARLALWFTSKTPDDAPERTWVNRLEDWASRRLGLGDSDQRAALERLMRLLEDDPDRGLEFALPLFGDPGRGRAHPNSQLGRRRVDFDLRGIGGGGGPADPWDVDDATYWKLRAAYQQLARTELAAGRHRRAAYIYANLLGDFADAANALRAGGFYREAAALYRERLDDDRAAADCLEQAGLFEEAAVLFASVGEHLQAGDLFAKVGATERAQACFREHVAERLDQHDALGAADVLVTRLGERQRGLEILLGAWPAGQQAEEALTRYFELLDEASEHDAVCRQIDALLAESSSPRLVTVLAKVARSASDPRVRARAADRVRVRTGESIGTIGQRDARRLLSAVTDLEPDDGLLARDAARFRESRLGKIPVPSTRPRGRLEITRTIGLPRQVDWRAFASNAVGWCVVAPGDRGLVFAGNWKSLGLVGSHYYGHRVTAVHARTREATSPGDPLIDLFLYAERPVIGAVDLDAERTDDLLVDQLQLEPRTFANCYNRTVTWSLRGVAGGLALTAHTKRGGVAAREFLRTERPMSGPIPLVCGRNSVVFAVDNLLVQRVRRKLTSRALAEPILELVAAPFETSPRVLAIGATSVTLIDCANNDHEPIDELTGLEAPLACFAQSHGIVVLSGPELTTYRSSPAGLTETARYEHGVENPLAIGPGPTRTSVAVMSATAVHVVEL